MNLLLTAEYGTYQEQQFFESLYRDTIERIKNIFNISSAFSYNESLNEVKKQINMLDEEFRKISSLIVNEGFKSSVRRMYPMSITYTKNGESVKYDVRAWIIKKHHLTMRVGDKIEYNYDAFAEIVRMLVAIHARKFNKTYPLMIYFIAIDVMVKFFDIHCKEDFQVVDAENVFLVEPSYAHAFNRCLSDDIDRIYNDIMNEDDKNTEEKLNEIFKDEIPYNSYSSNKIKTVDFDEFMDRCIEQGMKTKEIEIEYTRFFGKKKTSFYNQLKRWKMKNSVEENNTIEDEKDKEIERLKNEVKMLTEALEKLKADNHKEEVKEEPTKAENKPNGEELAKVLANAPKANQMVMTGMPLAPVVNQPDTIQLTSGLKGNASEKWVLGPKTKGDVRILQKIEKETPMVSRFGGITPSVFNGQIQLSMPKADDPTQTIAARVKEVDTSKYEYKHKDTNELF